MPVGPSYRDRCRSSLVASSGLAALPVTPIGRRWLASPMSAPSDTTIDTSSVSNSSMNSCENVRQRRFGSAPMPMT